MKLFSATIVIAIFMFGCTKNESTISNIEEPIMLSSKAAQVNQMGSINVSAQRNAYQMLSASDKSSLWQRHLISFLKSGLFNENQNKIITEVLKITKNVDFFSNNNNSRNTNEAAILHHKILSNFSPKQALVIFSSLNDFNPSARTDEEEEIGPGDASCSCSTQSSYCGIFTCYDTSCRASSRGCGWLWDYSCNGECRW